MCPGMLVLLRSDCVPAGHSVHFTASEEDKLIRISPFLAMICPPLAGAEGQFRQESSFECGTNEAFALPPQLWGPASLCPSVRADCPVVCRVLLSHGVCCVFCGCPCPFHVVTNLSCLSSFSFANVSRKKSKSRQ